MNTTPLQLTAWQRFCRHKIFQALEQIESGTIFWDEHGTRTTFGSGLEPSVVVEVFEPKFYSELVWGGTIGASEAYARGEWGCSDLTDLIRIAARNPQLHETLDSKGSFLRKPIERWIHWLRRNAKRNSKKNIAFHYDLGNEFFEKFLDPTMMYSSALFESESDSLEVASQKKNDLICQKLNLDASHHILEIGTGWGGFAIHAAKHYGCKITTTTISKKQFAFAKKRIDQEGLTNQIEVLDLDYRDLPSLNRTFDHIVSIEMIEAVGHRYLTSFFDVCSKLLAPDGLMVLQGILIREAQYDQYRKSSDFIRRHIFPGGHLPSLGAIASSLAKATRLQITHLQDLTPSYERTLALWRQRFQQNIESIRQLGYPEEFLKMWEFYFCYCEGGFSERAIQSTQLVLSHPLDRRPPVRALV